VLEHLAYKNLSTVIMLNLTEQDISNVS